MGCFYVEIKGLSSRELFLISVLTIFNVKAQVPPRTASLTNNPRKKTFFPLVPHSGGTSVSSAGFFFELFGKKTLEHRVSIVIVIGLKNEGNLASIQGIIRVRRDLALSTAAKNVLGHSTRNHKLERLEPHFQFSATRSASKEGHGNCCRFATLTGVHQGAHNCLPK